MTMTSLLLLLLAYLLGSIPFGLLISWLFNLQDPRTTGSENIGTTNVLRSGNKLAALLTLLLDAGKGSCAVLLALSLEPSFAQWAGLCAVVGHIFPVWIRFRGGKGVATAFGVILVLSWPLASLCLLTWLSLVILTRYSSLSALGAVFLCPLYALWLNENHLVIFCIFVFILLSWTHRSNIGRLITGREPKIGSTIPPGSPRDR